MSNNEEIDFGICTGRRSACKTCVGARGIICEYKPNKNEESHKLLMEFYQIMNRKT